MFKQIFISYAKEDIEYAEKLYEFLDANGFEPWLDKKKLKIGSNWDFYIQKALSESTWIILLLSSKSIRKRGYVQKEYKAAIKYAETKLEEDIYIIPILIDLCDVPYGLGKFQWKMYDDDDTFAEVLSSIKIQREIYLSTINKQDIELNEIRELTMSLNLPYKNQIEENIKLPQFLNSELLDNQFINTIIAAQGVEIISGLRNFFIDDNFFLELNEISKEHLYVTVDYYLNFISKNALSLTLLNDSYQGGAHPNSYVHNFNFAFNPTRQLSLRNFIEIDDYHRFIDESFEKYLKVDEGDNRTEVLIMLKGVLSESYDVDFSFTEKTLTLNFVNFLPRVIQYYGRLDIPLNQLNLKINL